MKNPILKYELRHWSKSPIAYFLLITFFAFALVTMLGTGGYFDGPITDNGKHNYLNSAYALTSNGFLFTKLLLFAVAVFFGFGVYRDFQHGIHQILYSYPLQKYQYLFGKFFSASMLVILCSVVVYFALWIGEFMLGIDNPKITNFSFAAYLTAAIFYALTTLLIIGTFVFIIVSLTRNIYAGIFTVICFVLLQLILENIFFNVKNALAILDPFGQYAFFISTEEWNHSIKNSNAIPIGPYAIANRLFWGIISVFSFYMFSKKFDFQYDKALKFNTRKTKKAKPKSNISKPIQIGKVKQNFGFASQLKQTFLLSLYDFKEIVKNWMFIMISIFGLAAVFFLQLRVSNTGDFNLLPSTRLFIGAPLRIYTIILVLCTFIFSGILISRARTHKMNLLLDSNPIENWQLIFSKVLSISMMHVLQLLLFFMAGIGIQLINGYHHFEFGLYFIQLAILTFPILLVWNITSLLAHTIVPNVFIGLFFLTCLWLGAQSIEQLGIKTNLLKFNEMPYLQYSDFNGFGDQLKGYFTISKYWLSIALLFIPITFLFWKRGTSRNVIERLLLAKQRINFKNLMLILISLICLGFTGSKLYQEEKIKNSNSYSSDQMRDALALHKKGWKKYNKMVQPKITDIDLELNLFPYKRRFEARGNYILINESDSEIDTVFIRTGFDEITELDWNGKAKEIKSDTIMKCHLFKLDEGLLPGDSISFTFSVTSIDNNLLSKNSSVLRNGTFLKQDILPRIGYQFSESVKTLEENQKHEHHFYHRDAHKVNLKTKISTSKDQHAIAPGDLVNSEKTETRNTYYYETKVPEKLNFSFHSGKYQIATEEFDGKNIQVYYHNHHGDNIKSIINGIKASLEYNAYFGEYPYEDIRIIEFPITEESYAGTLTCNNIPSSELLFNMNKEMMKNKSDMPYYVMAHELTHEWFGNQLKAADAPGAKMLSESITEYITLCIYREKLGDQLANSFLETQFKRYTNGKKKEKGTESPLYLVQEHQQYIAYGKGTIALNEIRKIIGEDKLKQVLSLFLNKYREDTNEYPTSLDFISLLKNEVSIAHHTMIDKWLMEVHEFSLEDILN